MSSYFDGSPRARKECHNQCKYFIDDFRNENLMCDHNLQTNEDFKPY